VSAGTELAESEKLRIHIDWWGKCRTCTHWSGDRVSMKEGPCVAPGGPLQGQVTWTEGHCAAWTTFDAAIAAQALSAV
jgi:hypothetical protein